MKTLEQVAARLDTTDRQLIRTYLDHNNRKKAIQYVRDRLGKGPVMAEAVVNFVEDI